SVRLQRSGHEESGHGTAGNSMDRDLEGDAGAPAPTASAGSRADPPRRLRRAVSSDDLEGAARPPARLTLRHAGITLPGYSLFRVSRRSSHVADEGIAA